jgi:peptidoglycan-associated lipoprotein
MLAAVVRRQVLGRSRADNNWRGENAMKRNVRIVALLAVGLVVGACSKKQPPAAPEPTPPAPVQQQTQAPQAPRDDSAERERAAELRRLTAILEQMVFFDYDESTLRVDAQEALAAKVPFLRSNPSIRMRIDGHADERGSVEYNLALGMRRANAVREYLTGFGIDASRFETFSFGEDQPLASGSNESAWSQNRRAEFRVTSGLTP